MKNLRNLRKQCGLLQSELGKIFHAAQNTVSQWENGTKMPSCEIIEEIADYFDVTVDYLLGREEKKSSEFSDDLSNKIMEMFKRLDDTKQNQALEYLEFLVARDNQKN